MIKTPNKSNTPDRFAPGDFFVRLHSERTTMSGNTAKYLSYAEAWRRIDRAISEGFYFEAVTLQEGIIADRLLSFAKGVEPASKLHVRTNLAELIKRWRQLAGDLPRDSSEVDLGFRVDAWRRQRNEVVHGLVKSEPGQATEPVGAFIERCREAAVDGRVLAKEVQLWHKWRLARPELVGQPNNASKPACTSAADPQRRYAAEPGGDN